ncbi:DUF3263 domain-containing protein [Rhodococcus sp. NPDC060086]|uniref:DUF3263 domain-containing protein n=1 Tax=unclassified Rhodococcus (in: high G+C Gram-positive bacteria) TaxID=192944 RepID=UPI0036656D8D
MRDEAAMLAFALKWRHWNGGPDEDIFVEFGITPPEFFHRLRVLLTRDRWNRLDPEILDQLVKVCDERIGAIDIRSVADRDRTKFVSPQHPLSRLSA